MQSKYVLGTEHPQPVCVGTGLLALDVLMNGDSRALSSVSAGGSCGNVLAILSYLGWKTYPIARLGKDRAAEALLKDLSLWNVKTDLIFQDQSDRTPLIVERLKTRRGASPQHEFKLTCPICGVRLPRYCAVSADTVKRTVDGADQVQVFYFDRVRKSSIKLAELFKARGALVFFEPSSIRNRHLFVECLQLADIVKYSHERLDQVDDITQQVGIPLEIETLSVQGLRYRHIDRRLHTREWKTMTAYPVCNLVDAAGSGDWCSAGIIQLIGNRGRKGFEEMRIESIETALRFGQALATLNCSYEGARGSMYSLSKQKFVSSIQDIVDGNLPTAHVQDNNSVVDKRLLQDICPSCISRGKG
jgi:fructokinase